MTENNKFQYCEEENGEFPFPYIQTDDGETIISLYDCWKHLNILCDKNEQLKKENQKLKTQLLHGDGVCDICKHEYLVKTGNYYVPKCKKGHEECSQIDLAYCGDFEVKELEE